MHSPVRPSIQRFKSFTLRVRRLPSSSWTGRQCHQPPPLRDKCPREFQPNTESCILILKCTLIRFASFNAGNFLLKNPYEVRGKVSKTQRLPSQYRSLSFHHGLGKLILTNFVLVLVHSFVHLALVFIRTCSLPSMSNYSHELTRTYS